MSGEEKLTVTLPTEVAEGLRRLAARTERSVDELTAIALERLIQEENPLLDLIEEGVADIEAGRVFTHDEVMADIDAIIERAERRRRAAGG